MKHGYRHRNGVRLCDRGEAGCMQTWPCKLHGARTATTADAATVAKVRGFDESALPYPRMRVTYHKVPPLDPMALISAKPSPSRTKLFDWDRGARAALAAAPHAQALVQCMYCYSTYFAGQPCPSCLPRAKPESRPVEHRDICASCRSTYPTGQACPTCATRVTQLREPEVRPYAAAKNVSDCAAHEASKLCDEIVESVFMEALGREWQALLKPRRD